MKGWPPGTPWVWPPSGASAWLWPPSQRAAISPTPPDHALLYDYWHSEFGIALNGGAVDSWTGNKSGIVVPYSTNRPPYGTDLAHFAGKPVVQCSATASLWKNVAPPITPVGGRPCVFSVYRYRTLPPASTQAVITIGKFGVQDTMFFAADSAGPRFFVTGVTGVIVVQNPMNTLPHSMCAWNDGTNGNAEFDGVRSSIPNTGSTSVDLTSFAFGANAGSGTNWRGDTTHAFHAIFTGFPGDAYLQSLTAWARGYWSLS